VAEKAGPSRLSAKRLPLVKSVKRGLTSNGKALPPALQNRGPNCFTTTSPTASKSHARTSWTGSSKTCGWTTPTAYSPTTTWRLSTRPHGRAGRPSRRAGSRPNRKLPVAAKRAPRAAARRRQRSPDRQASIERRRRLAASGPMPPALAARFTTSELAALRIIGDEVRHHGVCAPRTPLKPLPRPTSFAGCRTTMSLAVRFRVETFEPSEGLPRKRPCPTPDQCPHARSACGPARLAVPESLANHANSIDGQTARAAASSQTQSALYQ
jgi:hypothetical protein